MRVAVAREKILQANHVRVQRGPDQDRAAGAVLDQGDPPQNERAHDLLAELGFGDDDAAQPLGGNEQRLDIRRCARIDQRRTARQLSDFGKELARPFLDDRNHMAQAVPGADRNRAFDEHKHAGARFAGHESRDRPFCSAGPRRTGGDARSPPAGVLGTSDRGVVLSWT